MSYVEQVIKASGGHAAPAENLEEEAALEKNPGDPCWDGYVQVGVKDKKGKMVPNCVPAGATIDSLVEYYNTSFGESRHVSADSAYEVARSAADKYSDMECGELHDAVLWEVNAFMGYATTGDTEHRAEMSSYVGLLNQGHPDIRSSLTASALWLAGASEVSESSRQAIVAALTVTDDELISIHASTRLQVLIASGALADDTLTRLEELLSLSAKSE